ncbi:MAG: hypothetical protein ABMB14_04050 [Myxococcota bacterium]
MTRRVMVLATLVGCATDAETPVAADADWLVRASLDLRGVRPSLAELDRIAADPTASDALLDDWLADMRFELRVRDLFARVWRTRVDDFDQGFFDSGFDLPDTAAFREAVGDEPLVVIGRVAALDLPYTEIVTSPVTWASAPLAKAFPVTYPEGATGWQEVVYTDGRQMAGVLSTNGTWWRYQSTPQNYNRGRANALSRILLCSDFAARPVSFSRTEAATTATGGAVDEAAVDRTATDPTCLSCHAGLDPLGSFLYGFRSFEGYSPSPTYALEDERAWIGTTGVPPSYFGAPASDLRDLGVAIANDPRFVDCAVQTVYTGLYEVDVAAVDPATLDRHRDAFLADGARLKALYRSIVTDPAYAGAPRRLLPVESLAAAVTDVTAYRWELDGLRTLGGGVDGRVVTRPASAPSPTTVLVQQRLAELAAPYAVLHDAERPAADQLFAGLTFEEDVDRDRAVFDATLTRLVRRALGRSPHAGELDGLRALWSDAEALTDPQNAWAAVLTVLLRDPEFVLY